MSIKYSLVLFIFIQLLVTSAHAYEPSGGLNYIDPGNSEFRCVYRNANKNAAGEGDWVVDDCDYVGAHYACYNGSQWQVAQALGSVTDSGEPQDGDTASNPKIKSVDLWDPIKADGVCKNNFGPSYFFSVPIDEGEDLALGVAIANIIAAKKRTWIYYYSNDDIPKAENYWLGNRSEYTNWLDNNPDNKSAQGNADCILLNRDTGYWQDESCSAEHAFACFESGEWLLTKRSGQWRDGFATCQTDYSATSIYAVPRDSGENAEISAVTPPAGADAGIDFNQVWLNQTDLAYEEFFISNQTRQSWWAEGQPTNRNNADCTLINSTGDWISESCDLYQAYHACYIGDSSAAGQWVLTNSLTEVKGKAISSYGFGYCKRLADNAEFRAPDSGSSNTILANLIKAQLGDDAYVWLNFSDQGSEGAWKTEISYQDFESSTSVTDDNKDCVYYSSQTNDEGNWVADECYEGGKTRGFACTNGYEWKVASLDARVATKGDSLESDLWKDGFDACGFAFGADYYFAAPSSADDNSRLGLALSLTAKTSAWVNVNDATNEGVWVANGPSVNLAPVLTLPTNLINNEKVAINLTVGAVDPEDEGIAFYAWSILDTRIGKDGNGLDTVIAPTLSGESTAAVTVSATDLLNDTYYIDLQLQVTDGAADPATTTVFLTLTILPPLKAAYNFDNYINPRLDWTGNGHELILNTGQVKITDKTGDGSDYFAKMDANDLFEIDGSVNGLQVGNAADDQYTILYRFKLDEFDASNTWSNFLMKGSNADRQPGIFVRNPIKAFDYRAAADSSPELHVNGKEDLRLGQWVTGAYVKTATEILTYIDKVEGKLDDPTSPEDLTTVPDAALTKSGTARYNNGNWKFGNETGDATTMLGFVGGIDDIRIYDRALTVDELKTLFPDQPKGRFEFNQASQETEESPTSGNFFTLSVDVDRIEGDDDTVSVGYVLKSGSALLNTDFKLPGSDADAIAGRGFLDWGIHDRDPKTLTVQILADDLREGTESFTIELEAQPGEPGITEKKTINIDVLDKTPNVYGAIDFASSAGINEAVKEGDAGVITVRRFGDDTQGAVDVWYTVQELTAFSPEHFSILEGLPDYVPEAAAGNIVGRGKLTFVDGSPLTEQIQTISFDTNDIAAYDPGKVFITTLDKITDVGSNDLSDAEHSAILGPNKSYAQLIEDVTPGRISFKQADFGSIDEDAGSANRIADIVLERKEGTSGAICVDFGFSGAGISSADYTFNSLTHTGDNNDVFWLDGEGGDRTIQITAIDDQAYEVLETLTITWQLKTNCDYDASAGNDPVVTPNTPIAGDNATTILAINDQTNDIELKFGQSLYTTTEQGEPTLNVTVYATQTGSFADLGALSNKTPFSVYLNRVSVSADEIDHYGDLTSQQVISFAADQTSKVISIPIVDNCDAADNLIFNMNLTNDDVSLPSTNPPTGLLKVDSASTQVSIDNYSAVPTVTIGYHYDGITDSALRANWNADGGNTVRVTSKISSGQRTPKVTQMGVKADIGHACYKTLQYTWVNSDDTSPARPVVSGLSNFSMMPVIAGYDKVDASGGGAIHSDLFNLPFIIKQNTKLAFELEIIDPEIGNVEYTANSANVDTKIAGLAHEINMKQSYRRIENNNEGGNNCVASNSSGYGSCGNTSGGTQLAYNEATRQLVWYNTGGVKCLGAPKGSPIYTTDCGTSDQQKWKLVDGGNYDGVQLYGDTSYHLTEYIVSPYFRLATGGTSGARRFTWDTFGVGSGG